MAEVFGRPVNDWKPHVNRTAPWEPNHRGGGVNGTNFEPIPTNRGRDATRPNKPGRDPPQQTWGGTLETSRAPC